MLTERKVLVFDMDGTLNKFEEVEGWLDDLKNESVRPYLEAKPKYDMDVFCQLVERLRFDGWMICITTWLAGGASKAYNEAVRRAKREWLDVWGMPYDKLSMVKHGTTKANCTRKLGGFQILFDDNEKVRKGWTLGDSVDANEDIIPYLENLLLDDIMEM